LTNEQEFGQRYITTSPKKLVQAINAGEIVSQISEEEEE